MPYPFRYLAFEGGGVWGVAYGGALLVLDEAGILDEIEGAAGTSAGSIAALAVALRFDGHRMRKLLRDLDFERFTDQPEPLKVRERFGWYNTTPMQAWAEDLIRAAGPNFGLEFTGQESFADLKRAGARDLVVFATNLNRRRAVAFSALNTPNTPVAEAIRASISIPGFFQATEMTVEGVGPHIYVDGGVLINYPIMAFDRGKPNKATLGLKFIKHDQRPNAAPAALSFGDWSHWARLLYDTISNQRNELLFRTPIYLRRTVFVEVGEISPVDFSLSDWAKNELMNHGRIAAEHFLLRWRREHSLFGRLRRLLGWRPERLDAGLHHSRLRPAAEH